MSSSPKVVIQPLSQQLYESVVSSLKEKKFIPLRDSLECTFATIDDSAKDVAYHVWIVKPDSKILINTAYSGANMCIFLGYGNDKHKRDDFNALSKDVKNILYIDKYSNEDYDLVKLITSFQV